MTLRSLLGRLRRKAETWPEPNQFDRHSPQTREWLINYATAYKTEHGEFPPVEEARRLLKSREEIPAWMRSVIEASRLEALKDTAK